jgi:hypothetical protein
MNTKTIKKTLEQTTQYDRMPNGTILKKHYKSPFPALNVQHRDERVTRDTIYSNAPDIDGVRPVPRSLSTWKAWLQTSMV